MKLLVAVAPERYRDEELDEPLAVFKERGIGWDISSVKKGICTGMLGAKVPATLGFSDADPVAYDGLVIIGGAGSVPHLWGNRDLARLAGAFHSAQKPVAAICLSPVVLARAGILKGKKATVFRSPDAVAEMRKGGAVLTDLPVVVDGTVITADGPAAARAFGTAVAAALAR
ncbi:MAG TPA: DJ-1/PfpI family protein [Methanoregulaceae archaeon]|nr:DJ-1/PfpI family protein [Methanoregulaceae archaeon]HPD76473.1 DJ-1/PfpI family protein [Methanoregulaceae archaeon]HRY76333.1 DJ-1/PfpI family protein [Methanoregulaceae archaeon]